VHPKLKAHYDEIKRCGKQIDKLRKKEKF